MIYICVPTHNEQQTVGVVLWKLRQVLTDFPRDYQLLVADDASTDKTAAVLEPYTRVLPLTVIRSERQLGYAASLEMLLREAVRRSEYPKRDVIVALQADFSDEPEDVVALVKRLEAGADVAVGNKVSDTRETRGRRLSLALARFFTRRVKWPEGLESPFDGYRAYRLYAVKKAMEERAGRRLIRFDGWAGHAELLRAVLPHARRVDVVNVEDRTDRLQRPRREKPFPSAMQVRALSGATEPAGLIGVEELDRIAATASSSRDRGTIGVQATQNGRSRTNGGRTRDRRPADRTGRTRSQGERSERTRRSGPERTGERQPRARAESSGADRQPRGRTPRGEGSERPKRERQPRQKREEAAATVEAPQDSAAQLNAEAGSVAPETVTAAEPGAETKPKRRRRRRRRSSGKTAEGGQDSPASVDGPEAEAGSSETGSAGEAEGEGNGEGGAKKRRRRGGRRGGRNRRRRPESQETGESPPEYAADGAAQSAAPVESD